MGGNYIYSVKFRQKKKIWNRENWNVKIRGWRGTRTSRAKLAKIESHFIVHYVYIHCQLTQPVVYNYRYALFLRC